MPLRRQRGVTPYVRRLSGPLRTSSGPAALTASPRRLKTGPSHALRGQTASDVEYVLRRRDTAETRTCSYSFAPIRGERGRIGRGRHVLALAARPVGTGLTPGASAVAEEQLVGVGHGAEAAPVCLGRTPGALGALQKALVDGYRHDSHA